MGSLFTSELKEGMITAADTYSTSGHLILPKDTVITKSVINKLAANNVVFVDIVDVNEVSADENAGTIDLSDLSTFSEAQKKILDTPAYKKFKRRYEKGIDEMKDNLNDIVNKFAPINVDEMVKNTLNIVKAADSPLSVLTMISTLKEYDDSTFNHSLNVALICNIFAKWLGLDQEKTELLTSCGLLHDIGKLAIPDSIIKKPGKLTDEEYQIVKQHTKKGYEILKRNNVDIHIQYAALMHHEKCDGSGYPLGLKESQIDWCAQIVTIADIYEAMTANRVYREALSPVKVITMFEEDGLRKYNPKYLLTFLEHVVNSYVNCKVKLSNGEEGDIVYINKVNLSKPLIKTKNSFIDLSKNSAVSIESVM